MSQIVEMDIEEYCQFEECQRLLPIAFGCTDCNGTFCKDHHDSHQHDCPSQYNTKNKNIKSVLCTSTDTINEMEWTGTGAITRCALKDCNKASDIGTDVFLAFVCDRCKQTYCSLHHHMEDHACHTPRLTIKAIAINNGYWECVVCGFINTPSTEQCMVCHLLSNTTASTSTSVLHETVCPYCKKAVDEYRYEAHLKRCNKKMDIDLNEDVNQICPKCNEYVHYATYVSHTMNCNGDTCNVCPVCSKVVPNATYDKHLALCYKKPQDEPQQCPFCSNVIHKDFTDHLSVCAADMDDVTDTLVPKKKKKHVTFKGISSPNMPSRVYKRSANYNQSTKRGVYSNNRSRNSKPKHLWRQTTVHDVVRISPQKRRNSSFESNDEPKRKRRRIDHTNSDYKQYTPNQTKPNINPYFDETAAYLKALKRDGHMDDDVYCYWYVPAQHKHSMMVYKITEHKFDNGEDISANVMDFALKYIYVQWIAPFKERVYIFSSQFYEHEVRDMDSDGADVTYFDFVFDTDFLVIPHMNVSTNCWEMIIICYPNCIVNKKAKQKPCIVTWDILQKDNRGKNKMNSTIRKWLEFQYKKKYNKGDGSPRCITCTSMKAYNKAKVPKLMNICYTHESGWYQLLNLKKWGVLAGYKNTTNLSKLSPIKYGYKQVKEYKQCVIQNIKRLHNIQS
eukprot:22081_1